MKMEEAEMKAGEDSSDVFTCTLCGDCCMGYGGTLVSEADAAAIARFLGIGAEDFAARFLTDSALGKVLVQREDGRCAFWDRVCTIHPVKPRMCRRWPFIPAVAEHPENWRAMAGSCPGMKAGAEPCVVARLARESLAAESVTE